MEGPKKAAIASAFKKFDINGDGTISEEELRQVMMALDPSLSHSDLEIIFFWGRSQQGRSRELGGVCQLGR